MQIDGADVSTEDFVNLGSECVFLSHGIAREEKQAGCVAIRKMRGSVRGGKQNVPLGLQVLGVTLFGRACRGGKRPSKIAI